VEKGRAPSLYLQVLLAITIGVWLGSEHPALAVELKPLGDYFVKLIKLLIAPIVFCTVSHGIAGMGDLKRAGRVGVKAVLYFEVMTTVALALGLIIVRTLKPGAGLHAVPDAAETALLNKTLAAAAPKDALHSALDWVVNVVTGQNVIPVLLVALAAGILMAATPKQSAPWVHRIERVSKLLFQGVRYVMWLAPLGALGAMAFTVGKFGLGTLANLAKLMGSFYATALLFVLVVLGLVMRAMGLRISKLLVYLRDELALVLGTSSSEAALPRLMQKLEAAGCKGEVVRMVVPTGYSFNLDGTCIYLTMAAIFVAQATDAPVSLGEELKLLAVLLVTSKGAAGVTGSGFIVLAATLSTSGVIPVSGLALLLGVDRFMSEARALTNMIGNAVATLVVSRWEKAVDQEVAKKTLG
jgi:aerobic C4-dicarboxylate transport protein